MSIEFLDCLKRERDISIKAMSSGGKLMALRLSPPLSHGFDFLQGLRLSLCLAWKSRRLFRERRLLSPVTLFGHLIIFISPHVTKTKYKIKYKQNTKYRILKGEDALGKTTALIEQGFLIAVRLHKRFRNYETADTITLIQS